MGKRKDSYIDCSIKPNDLTYSEYSLLSICEEIPLDNLSKIDEQLLKSLEDKDYIKIFKDEGIISTTGKVYTGSKLNETITNIISFFNKTRNLKRGISLTAQSNRTLVKARLMEYSEEDIKITLEYKIKQWKNDPHFKKYLRLETLLNATKFQGYFLEAQEEDTVTDRM